MRKLFTLAALATTICSFAQDIIVTNKAQKIDAKILEVTSSEIRYKELDNLDGPTFILRIDEINSIIYANGKVVLCNQQHSNEISEKQKSAEATAKANALAGLFGNPGNVGQKGNPTGLRITGGNSWTLSGRGIRGTLPQPSNNFNQEGKVVVQIRVNAAGNVVDARCANGTTITDYQTQKIALEAAKKAKFTEGEYEQIGTITYIFRIN